MGKRAKQQLHQQQLEETERKCLKGTRVQTVHQVQPLITLIQCIDWWCPNPSPPLTTQHRLELVNGGHGVILPPSPSLPHLNYSHPLILPTKWKYGNYHIVWANRKNVAVLCEHDRLRFWIPLATVVVVLPAAVAALWQSVAHAIN